MNDSEKKIMDISIIIRAYYEQMDDYIKEYFESDKTFLDDLLELRGEETLRKIREIIWEQKND